MARRNRQEELERSRNMKEGTEGKMKKISTKINIEIWDKEFKRDLWMEGGDMMVETTGKWARKMRVTHSWLHTHRTHIVKWIEIVF